MIKSGKYGVDFIKNGIQLVFEFIIAASFFKRCVFNEIIS